MVGIQQANRDKLAKAGAINLLMGGFGLQEFYGSGLSQIDLLAEIAVQDANIKKIGLTRSQAFQIIDTDGRGRSEIDDRLRFHERLASMSSGVSPL